MTKTCKFNNCTNPVFSHFYCKYHYHPTKKPKIQQNSSISPISDKRKKQGHEYTILRKQFLIEHPMCEAKLSGCLIHSTEIHHKMGREGLLLIDKGKFLAICRPCHQFVSDNSALAIELGLSIKRN